MATNELGNAFEKLKFSPNEHSPAFFENNGKGTYRTSRYRAEMLEYKSTSKEMSEKPCIEGKAYMPDLKWPSYVYKKSPVTEDSYYCKSHQRTKQKKEECKGTLPAAETLETKTSAESCNEILPEAKTLEQHLMSPTSRPNNHTYGRCNNPGKSVNRVKNYKRILTTKEKNLLEIMERSGRFRRAKPPFEFNNVCSVNTDTFNVGKSALSDDKSPESDLPVDNDCDNTPCGWVVNTRYTQAARMASPPIILSEIWDDEEEW